MRCGFVEPKTKRAPTTMRERTRRAVGESAIGWTQCARSRRRSEEGGRLAEKGGDGESGSRREDFCNGGVEKSSAAGLLPSTFLTNGAEY